MIITYLHRVLAQLSQLIHGTPVVLQTVTLEVMTRIAFENMRDKFFGQCCVYGQDSKLGAYSDSRTPSLHGILLLLLKLG